MYKLNAATRPVVSGTRETSSVARGARSSLSRITLISAWRYPGVTKKGERPEIPADVLEQLEQMGDDR